MVGTFRFDPDPKGIEEVTTGEEVAPLLDDAAAEAEAQMRRLAARHARSSFMGYRDSIGRVPATRGPDGTYQAAAGSSSPVWHLEEYGTAETSPGATLRRGITDAGLRFEER